MHSYATPTEKLCAIHSGLVYSVKKGSLSNINHLVVNDNAQCGLVLIDDVLIIAHAGTNDAKDALDDAVPGARYTPSGVKVRKGFYEHARATWRPVRRLIRDIDPSKVIFTGHSLGGAVAAIQAQLCFELFAQHQNTVELVTFGAPRCFSPGGASRVNENLEGRITRFVAKGDLVPSVPTSLLWRHTEGLAYLSGGFAYREEKAAVQSTLRNWGNLIRGTLSLAKHHSMSKYSSALYSLPEYEAPEYESPTAGYEVITA